MRHSSGLERNHRLMQPHRQTTADEVVESNKLISEFVEVNAKEKARLSRREPESE